MHLINNVKQIQKTLNARRVTLIKRNRVIKKELKMKGKSRLFLKKIFLIALAAVISLSAFSGCAVNGNGGSEGKQSSGGSANTSASGETEDIKYVARNDSAYVWGAPDTVAVLQDMSVKEQCEYGGEEWLDDSDKLCLEGIKGDVAAVQVMVTAKKDVSSFELKAGELKHENGSDVIAAENFEILAERYIEVANPSAQSISANCFIGWYPDALVPMSAYKAKKDNKIKKSENQGIWLNVTIPEDASAGTYKGTMKLDLDGAKLDLPVSVKVYDVSMPSEIHAKTSFNIWYGEIEKGEELTDENGNEIDWGKIYYDFLVSKRITPQLTEYMSIVYVSGNNYSKFVSEMVDLARNEKVTSYRVPYAGKSDPDVGNVVDYDKMVAMLTAMAEKNIELKQDGEDVDLFKKAYFYFASEIDEPKPSNYGAVRYCDRAVANAKKAVAPLLNDYPELKASLLKIPHVVTATVDCLQGNEIVGGVQTWCSEAQRYSSEVLSDIKARKQSKLKYSIGEGFWIYMTMTSKNPFPSLQTDENLLSPRTTFWMNSYYGIDCYLYWNVCNYSKYIGEFIRRDIWNDPNTYYSVNGDGQILYPGSKYGLKTPISTLRLESLRQGTEDYEYLYLLENALTKYNLTHEKTFDMGKVMQRFYSAAFDLGSTTSKTNIAAFTSARSELLELLEAVENNASSARALLEKYEVFEL